MRKRIINVTGAIAVVAMMVSSVSAALLADFEMNDAAGTRLAKLQNDAVGGGGFNYGADNMLADGNGLMVYTLGGANANYARADLPAVVNTGSYKLSFSFDSATLDGTGGSLTYAIRDNTAKKDLVSVQFLKNNDRLRLVMQNWDQADNITDVGTYSLTDTLNVEVIFNLDTDLATFSWVSGANSGSYTDVAINDGDAEVVRNAYQPSGMTATDFFKTDYLKVESIPEPATLSLVGLTAGAIFFIRRHHFSI
jgi:hypothetical protein